MSLCASKLVACLPALAACVALASCGRPTAGEDVVRVQSAVNSNVLVTVVDGTGAPQANVDVQAVKTNGTIQTNGFTNASGQVSLSLPASSYRFQTEEANSFFYSGAAGHCTTPACTTATITIRRVDVYVVNTSGTPQVGQDLYWKNASDQLGGYAITGANGHALFAVPDGSYKFTAEMNGFEFESGPNGHCTVPGCTAVTITTTLPVTVTVTNTNGVPQPNIVVAWEDSTRSDGYLPTNASGVVQLSAPQGSFRFFAQIGATEWVSGAPGHCTIPGCTSASIVISLPVDVAVVDTAGAPLSGKTVKWERASDGYLSGSLGTTNASGHVTVYPPADAVRFVSTVDGTDFYSGAAGHCSQPTCASTATILVSQQTVVTVVDGNGAVVSGKAVTPLSDEGTTSANKTTNTSGQATFRLPFGHWRFRAKCASTNEPFYSGNAGHCYNGVAGCVTSKIKMPCGQCTGKANGFACDDQTACSGTSTCQSQFCTGANLMSCSSGTACSSGGACSAETGACTGSQLPNGTSCANSTVCDGAETCQNGVCTAGTQLVTEDNNPCTQDSCDPVLGVQHVAGNAGAVCRTANGTCDVAETCTGTSTSCPADGFLPSTTTCRDANGLCDVAETCTGTSAACPGDSFASAGATCRNANGLCDVAEVCSGTSAACPADGFASAGTSCRGANGECDVAEVCTGTSAACPTDAVKPNGTACAADSNPCTADVCNGTAVACTHPAGNAGTTCREANGDCDIAEACTGSSTDCPADGFKASTTVCRDVGGLCDVAERCTGTSATCPTDAMKPSGTECRGANGECDVAEACTGTTAACPADGFKSSGTACTDDGLPCSADVCSGSGVACTHPAGNSGTVCRDANGSCDVAESCTGTSTDCPADGFAAATTTCRDAVGDCDVAEKCTGSSGACPSDAFASAGTTCRAAVGECDLTEVCTGANAACPNDALKPDGTVCADDGNPCSTDTCNGTSTTCTHPAGNVGTVCRQAAGSCDVAESCTGTSTSCPMDGFVAAGTSCRSAANDCDLAEVCSGSAAACPTDSAKPNGSTCTDGNSCTSGDSCTAGLCAPGTNTCVQTVTVSKMNEVQSLSPNLDATATANPVKAMPGQPVTFLVQATYDGVTVNAYDDVGLTNNGTAAFTVPGYSDTLEYQSATTNEWIPVARADVDTAGQPIPQTTLPTLPVTAGLVYVSDPFGGEPSPIPTPGVTYPNACLNSGGDCLAGTRIAAGSTARVALVMNHRLPLATAQLLLDPTKVSALRVSIHINPTTGLGAGADVHTSIDAPASTDIPMTAIGGSLAVNLSFPGATLIPASSDPLPLGGTMNLSATSPAPALSPPNPVLDPLGYASYLHNKATSGAVPFSASVQGTAFGQTTFTFQDGTPFGYAIPILTAAKSGPATALAGFTVTYPVALQNTGNAEAVLLSVVDSVGGTPVTATITTPSSLAPAETDQATIVYQTPTGQPAGPFTDKASVQWKDTQGNSYGPVSSSFTTTLAASVPQGLLSIDGGGTLPTLVGSARTVTATALTSTGAPAVGVSVHLTVTGANPQTVAGTTNSSGVAQLNYTGSNVGADALVASATIVSSPIQSNTAIVEWGAARATSCAAAPPLDVMLIIDASDSMIDEGKLGAAKTSAKSFVDLLDLSTDQVGFGLFNINGNLVTPLTRKSATVKAAIDAFGTGPFTNIGGGLDVGRIELTGTRHNPAATPLLVFLSDGGNSWGNPEPPLGALKASGIRTVAIGLGSDIDGVMLRRIASTPSDYFYSPAGSDLQWVYSAVAQSACRNPKPLVRAGGNQGAYGVRLPHVLALNGEVHDAGPAGNPELTSVWSVVSGPGSVAFADASSPATTAIFQDPGVYVLKLEASDGLTTVSDTATITVDPEPSLVGASLVAQLGTPGPLVVGTNESLVVTLTDSSSQPIADFPVEVSITGPNARTLVVNTNASGVVTVSYVGRSVGTDVLSAVALGLVQVSSTPLSVAWNSSSGSALTQGWIGLPAH
jgi:Mg-chelatase subunit ChlD